MSLRSRYGSVHRRIGTTRSLVCGTAALAATAVLLLSSQGCGGNSAPPVRLEDAIAITEDTLTEVLLGAAPGENISQAPPDKPLLQHGVYDTVWIAADEKGFEKISRGALRESSVKRIEDQVTRTVSKRLERRGYAAKTVAYPVPADQTASADHTLLATLIPTIQEAGSPEDKAKGKERRLVLVRLTVSDAKTGEPLAIRDYYSGSDVTMRSDRDRRPPNDSNDDDDELSDARNRATVPWRRP